MNWIGLRDYYALVSLGKIRITPLFFALGLLFMLPRIHPELPPGHIANLIDKDLPARAPSASPFGRLGIALEGRILSPPESLKEKTRFRFEAQRALLGGAWEKTSGEALIAVQGVAEGFKYGDRVRLLAQLREPENYGNPGEFDYKEWLSLKGVYLTGYVRNTRLLVKLEEGSGMLRHVEDIREAIRRFIDSSNASNKGALKALIIAERGDIPGDMQEAFVNTGAVHILVIAGLHIGMVAFFYYGFFIFLMKRSERIMLAINIKKAAIALTLAPVFSYGLLAGFPVSTRRVVVMFAAFTAAYLMDRGKDFYNTLALAALFMLVISPASAWDASFHLTILSVFFIVYLVPRFQSLLEKNKKDRIPEPVRRYGRVRAFAAVAAGRLKHASLVTIAASLGTAPILAYHFHQFSIFGLAANIISVPMASVIVPLLMVPSSFIPVSAPLSRVFLTASDAVFGAMLHVIRFFASLPYSFVWVSTPTLFEIILIYAFIICAANIGKRRASL